MAFKILVPVLSSLLIGLGFASSIQAQSYPTRPIRLIHGFAAGGQGDTIARILGQEMGTGLGQPIVVEGRPGADGNIATDAVAKSAPDGYTLLLVTGAVPISGAIYKTLPFNTVEDFQWLSTAMLFSFVLSARSDAKYQSIGDLIQAARGAANAVSFGSGGIGARLAGEMLASVARVKLLNVTYKGDAPAIIGSLAGDTDFIVTPATTVMAHLKSGKLKALAITGPNRWSGLASVPSLQEQGFPGFDIRSWIGLATRAGTPPAISSRLRAELLRSIQVPEVRGKLEGFGFEVQGSSSEEMRNRVASEIQQWKKIIAEAGIEQQP